MTKKDELGKALSAKKKARDRTATAKVTAEGRRLTRLFNSQGSKGVITHLALKADRLLGLLDATEGHGTPHAPCVCETCRSKHEARESLRLTLDALRRRRYVYETWFALGRQPRATRKCTCWIRMD